MDFENSVKLTLTVVGICGFLFGVFEYYKAQKWKRLEFASNQIRKIYEDEELRLALNFLIYSKRPITLPDRYREIASYSVIQHDSRKIDRILKIGHFESDPEYFIYRDSFDMLFTYLAQINDFIDMGLIRVRDANRLQGVVRRIANPNWAEKATE